MNLFNLNESFDEQYKSLFTNYSNLNYSNNIINNIEKINNNILESYINSFSKSLLENDINKENETLINLIEEINNICNEEYINLIEENYTYFKTELYNKVNSINQFIESTNEIKNESLYSFKYNNYKDHNQNLLINSNNITLFESYKREFDDIALLLQNTSVNSSNTEKLNIIKSVCESFSNNTDYDKYNIEQNYISDITDKNVTIDTYNNICQEMNNKLYNEYDKVIQEDINNFKSELKNISNDINMLLDGIKVNKFKVYTNEDGIKNTTYNIDKFSSNKLLSILLNKYKQLICLYDKVLNDIGEKMDQIESYFDQFKAIVSSIKYINDKEYSLELDDDEEYKESISSFTSSNGSLEESYINYNRNNLNQNINYFLQTIYEHNLSLLQEEDNKLSKATNLVKNAAEVKTSMWKSVIENILGIWTKFKASLGESYKEKIDKLEENVKYINLSVTEADITMPTISLSKFNEIDIPDLNYEVMKKYLNSKEEFIASQPKLKNFLPQKGENINSKVIDYCMDYKNTINSSTKVNVKEAYEFCKNYIKITDELNKMTKVLEQGQQKAVNISKELNKKSANTTTNESFITIESLYFNEADEDKNKDSKTNFKVLKPEETENGKKEIKKNDSTTTDLKIYFTVCGEVLVGKINASKKIFDNYYGFLNWHINKKKEEENKNGGNTDTQQTTTGSNDKVIKFD